MSYLQSPVSLQQDDSVFDETQWSDKKDRQLRLWGIHGQKRIDTANVLLLNATSVGCEVLKNIVLPGFGQFTVLDSQIVSEEDLGVNFYLRKSDLGESRARAVTECLCELNPDVKGNFMCEDPMRVFKEKPQFFDNYNYVIASQMPTHDIRDLAAYLYDRNIPLVIVRSFGLIGYVRIIKKTHYVIEAKLDNEVDDFRLSDPWDELQQFADEQDLDKMSNMEHSHTPYPLLLLKANRIWRQRHGQDAKPPSTRAEEEEFDAIIKEMRREYDETNFQEALKKSYYAYQSAEIPADVQAILQDSETLNISTNSEDFFIMANALKKFVENEGRGQLPLQGKVPDFHSDTDRYIKMQDIYRRKNRSDMTIVKKYVSENLRLVGRPENAISDMDIKEFCKNSFYLRVFHFTSLEEELDSKRIKTDALMEHTWNEQSPVVYYFMLRAVDRFHERHGKFPGQDLNIEDGRARVNEDEIAELSQIVQELLLEMGLSLDTVAAFQGESQFEENTDGKATRLDDYSRDFARYGGAEIHNISSLIGGVGGQELIKLCTHQRFPSTCFIFDGIHEEDSWENLNSSPTPGFLRRYEHGVEYLSHLNSLVVFGGTTIGQLEFVAVYNIGTGVWTNEANPAQFESDGTTTASISVISNPASVVFREAIYIITSGQPSPTPLIRLTVNDQMVPEYRRYQISNGADLPDRLQKQSAVLLGNSVLFFSGSQSIPAADFLDMFLLSLF